MHASPVLRPEVFFAGRTQGEGTLEQIGRGGRALRVEGRGRIEPDGSLRLDQVVRFQDGTVQTRTWRLEKTGPGAYSGELSDAAGPVSAQAHGNRVRLRYRIGFAMYMRQSLYLQPDGATVLNHATVTLLGIPWARLTERIRKLDG